eukprot:CAMPEP_0172178308 /NCGR_PEP_ID=MMETSP1050-20130122/15952_1 /TAXON_ID=233186 /ORGANISM="Cryptomonas curvata, Strain CCAP979/52" /LENGTH=272 /DNA_ID=CAMNT_0012850989 /DNA_START=32 /DNA_END=847 /DNA_ORIENTATION=-
MSPGRSRGMRLANLHPGTALVTKTFPLILTLQLGLSIGLSGSGGGSGSNFVRRQAAVLGFVPVSLPPPWKCARKNVNIMRISMQTDGGGDSRSSWLRLNQERKRSFGRPGNDDRGERGFRDQRPPRRDGIDRPPFNQDDRQARNDRLKEFTRGDDGLKPVDEEAVKTYLEQRERARRNKDFEMADGIRDELFAKLKVHVDDQRRIWWPDGTKPSDIGQSDLWGLDESDPGELNKAGWVREEPLSVEVDERRVLALLAKRDVARRARDFELAD